MFRSFLYFQSCIALTLNIAIVSRMASDLVYSTIESADDPGNSCHSISVVDSIIY
jgi:hypothetical protein